MGSRFKAKLWILKRLIGWLKDCSIGDRQETDEMTNSIWTMRKTIFKEDEKRLINIEIPKRTPVLDDSAIREILRGACRELEEDNSGTLMGDNVRILVIQTMEVPPVPTWVDPEFLKEKTNLLSIWGIYAQRQVVMFDQETRIAENWDERPLW